MSVFWTLAAGVFLLIIGAFGVWLYRSPRFEDNLFAALLSRWLGVGGARILMLAAGIMSVARNIQCGQRRDGHCPSLILVQELRTSLSYVLDLLRPPIGSITTFSTGAKFPETQLLISAEIAKRFDKMDSWTTNFRRRPAIGVKGGFRAWELKQVGWKQHEIAEALGVSKGAVSQWIRDVGAKGASRA